MDNTLQEHSTGRNHDN